jgi:hypothetical protein
VCATSKRRVPRATNATEAGVSFGADSTGGYVWGFAMQFRVEEAIWLSAIVIAIAIATPTGEITRLSPPKLRAVSIVCPRYDRAVPLPRKKVRQSPLGTMLSR